MPKDLTAHRLLPHLRRVAQAQDADSTDGSLLAAFVATQDEAAFATLVRRHGPMVLGVCRRVVGDSHLAEDAFQATFLVLARRAATVRPRHLVGHWLYGVAYRTALKARGNAFRLKAREKQVDAMPQPAVAPEDTWADLQPVLDEELSRLPEKYRVPIVLCDLGGRPQRDVAKELKLPTTTLVNRLATARRMLAKRLSGRGIALSTGAVTAALSWHAATSAVSPALACLTAKAACAVAAGGAAGLPGPVVELSDGVMRMFVLKKLKAAAATSLVLFAGLVVVADSTLRANPDEKPATTPTKAGKPADPSPAPESEDAKFLKRTSQELRGNLPSNIEMTYFLADADAKKRQKVVEWMLPEHGSQKATNDCVKCHVSVGKIDGLSEIQILGRLFQNVGKPHENWLHSYLDKTDAAAVRQTREQDIAKLGLERAQAEVEVTRAQLRLAEADAERAKANAAKVEEAKTRLAQVEAQLKLAEAELARAEEAARLRARLRQAEVEKKKANEVAKEIDRFILQSVETQKLTDTKSPTDAEFLRRLSLDVRGTTPTMVEMQYFLADKDPKKREKLLEMMLGKPATASEKLHGELFADPKVQERWAELYRARIQREYERQALEGWLKSPNDRLARLLKELLESKRPDDQVLDALCLATMARFPTATESKLVLDVVKAQPDRRTAWQSVLLALVATEEAKSHAEGLAKRSAK